MTIQLPWLSSVCPTPDHSARDAAIEHQQQLTKPAGSLGKLEELAIQFAAWQANARPTLNTISVRVFAADHGVCAQGVSAFPQVVTTQMVHNFLSGGAAISVLAKTLNADFKVVNMGTVESIDDAPHLRNSPIASGTADFSHTAAMTKQQLHAALNAGRQEVEQCDVFIGGEMGIANTCSASAIYAALLKLSAKQTVGPGTGLDDSGLQHKANIIDHALRLHQHQLTSPITVLQTLGGFEIAALVGAYISAAQARIPCLIDGFICTAAALTAAQINPSCRQWMLFSHQSAEPAHKLALDALKAQPLLDLGMRLGEGSGAAVAAPLIQNALLLHNEMATFTSAGVSGSDD